MRSILVPVVLLAIITSCSNDTKNDPGKTDSEKLPSIPASAAELKEMLKAKSFTAFKAGLVSADKATDESAYKWIEAGRDTTSFDREFLKKEIKFELIFNRDSTGVISYDTYRTLDSLGRVYDAPKLANFIYSVKEADKILSLELAVEEWNGSTGSYDKLISVYRVLGATNDRLLLLAPRGYMEKEVVVLMKETPNRF